MILSVLIFAGLQNQELNDFLMEYFKELVSEFEGLGIFPTALCLFFNNVFASFFGIVFGIFLAIPTLFFVVSNSYAIGFISRLSVDKVGFVSLWRLIPHGIFELPAVFISFALGLKLGTFVFARQPWKELKIRFVKSMKVFFLIVVPLLVVAAIIEGILMVVGG